MGDIQVALCWGRRAVELRRGGIAGDQGEALGTRAQSVAARHSPHAVREGCSPPRDDCFTDLGLEVLDHGVG